MTEPEGQPPGLSEAGSSEARDEDTDDQRVALTPGLVVLGLIAIALGVFSALVMSASTFGH